MLILLLLLSPLCTAASHIGFLSYAGNTNSPSYSQLIDFSNLTSNVTWLTYNRTSRDMVSVACTLAQTGVSLVVLVGTSDDAKVFGEFFSDIHIPIVAVGPTSVDLDAPTLNYLVRMSPDDNNQARVILSILREYNWNAVSILASRDSYGISGMLALQALISTEPGYTLKQISVYETEVDVDVRLRSLKESLARVIVLYGSTVHAKAILSRAYNMSLMSSDFVWIVSDAIALKPEVLSENGGFLSYYEGLLGTKPGILHGDLYREWKDKYTVFGASSYDTGTFIPLLYDTLQLADGVVRGRPGRNASDSDCGEVWEGGEELLNLLTNVTFEGVTGNISFTPSRLIKRSLFDVVNFREERFVKIGAWDDNSGLKMTNRPLFFNESYEIPLGVANQLKGTHLRIGAMAGLPFMSPALPRRVISSNLQSSHIGFLSYAGNTNSPSYSQLIDFSNLTSNVTWLTYNRTSRDMVSVACTLAQTGVSLVVLVGTSDDAKVFGEFFSDIHIPIVAVGPTSVDLDAPTLNYLVRMSPDDNNQARVILSILREYNWNAVSILASRDSYGISGMLALQALISTEPGYTLKQISVYETEVDVDVRLRSLKESLARVIVLYGSTVHAKAILSRAYNMSLMSSDFVWIVSDAIALKPEVLSENGGFLSYYEGLLGTKPGILHGDLYREWKDKYTVFGASSYDTGTFIPLLYDTLQLADGVVRGRPGRNASDSDCGEVWEGGEELLNLLTNVTFEGVTGNISFTPSRLIKRSLFDVVNFREERFVKIGAWDDNSGLKMTNRPLFFNESYEIPLGVANQLKGTHLRIGAMAGLPFMSPIDDPCTDDHCEPSRGMTVELVKRLSDELGFTYQFIFPKDGKYGGKNSTTGQWNGLIGELLEGRTDLIGSPLSMNSLRKEVIDFSNPLKDSGISAVVRTGRGNSDPFFFLLPYDTSVWLTVLAVCFVMALLQWCIGTWSPMGRVGRRRYATRYCKCEGCNSSGSGKPCLVSEENSEDLNLYESLWTVGTGLVVNNGEVFPQSPSGRFLLLTWWFFMLLIVTLYTANLTAFLTLSTQASHLDSVLELLTQDEYQWGFVGSANAETILLTHANSDYHRLVKEGVALANDQEGIERVKNDSFVFIGEYPELEYQIGGGCSAITYVGNTFQHLEWAFGLPRGSPYKELIDTRLLRYREMGYIDELWNKYAATGTGKCKKNVEMTLQLSSLTGLFYALVCGVAVALASFVIEFVVVAVQDVRAGREESLRKAMLVRLVGIGNGKGTETMVVENGSKC
eukprot:sb/3461133/